MTDKKVDESWKDKITAEKEEKPEQHSNTTDDGQKTYQMPPVDFNLFISSLGMQALMALGEIENPMTKKKEQELPQAKYLIDIISMLQEKTKGNLSDEESKTLEQLIYELRMKYISLAK